MLTFVFIGEQAIIIIIILKLIFEINEIEVGFRNESKMKCKHSEPVSSKGALSSYLVNEFVLLNAL